MTIDALQVGAQVWIPAASNPAARAATGWAKGTVTRILSGEQLTGAAASRQMPFTGLRRCVDEGCLQANLKATDQALGA